MFFGYDTVENLIWCLWRLGGALSEVDTLGGSDDRWFKEIKECYYLSHNEILSL